MENNVLLIIGHVWPEPTSSAAGWRMLQLIRLFLAKGYKVLFACAASRSPYSYPLNELGVVEHNILLNNSSFDQLVKELHPDFVLFDRFMVEEQYGWRVAQAVPSAVRILDTEDLHFLRKARQDAYKKGVAFAEVQLYSDLAKREIASILRCDLSLIISREEQKLLLARFHLPQSILRYLPFLEEQPSLDRFVPWKSFDQRQDFVFIGNFLHEPNWKTVQLLKTEYWPRIRKALPATELHIYGAYPSQKVLQLNTPKEGFLIKGRAEDALETLSKYRLLLAPIPFGAGLKGKFIDAMRTGTPSLSTTMGAEGMHNNSWPGHITDDPKDFVDMAITLYTDSALWSEKQALAQQLHADITASGRQQQEFIQCLEAIRTNRETHRNINFIGQILQSQQYNATRYMSLWIEEKNR